MTSAPIKLGVNIDHVATLRQARGTRYPDPVEAAAIAERAGAEGITVHLREDRRHIQDRDVRLLSEIIQTKLNLEMAVTDEMLSFAESLRPEDCCLVPEKREELTTEGGLDVAVSADRVQAACARLAAAGVRVSLFIDPEERQLEAARAVGAPVVELHTGRYADAPDSDSRAEELDRIIAAARYAHDLGLIVNAGHGLNYHNTAEIAAIPELNELNIGHAIIGRAVITGLEAAIRDMRSIMDKARAR